MVSIGADAALLVVGLVVVGCVGWASFVSVRSASEGPAWALDHLSVIRGFLWALLLVGLALAWVVDPPWMGLGVAYVGATVVFLGAMLRRSLLRLREYGGLEGIDPSRRSRIVRRARTLLLTTGLVFAVLGAAALAVDAGVVSWVILALGATLTATAAVQTGGLVDE